MKWLIPALSVATGTWGGLTRIMAITKAAQQAGHDVAFCASGYVAASLKEHGCRVYDMPAATLFGLPGPISRRMTRNAERMAPPIRAGKAFGNVWLIFVIAGFGRASFLRRLVEAELAAVKDFQPDLLFTDLDVGAFLLAEITGLPLARAYQGIIEGGVGSLTWRIVRRATASALRAYGKPPCPPETLFYGPRSLKIIPSIPELDGTDPRRSDVRYVGSLLGDIHAAGKEDFQPEAGKRYVFVYTGTGAVSLDTLRTVLPQVFPAGGDTICLVGSQGVTQPERIGAVEFRSYVPAGAVLPHCDWTICHGGQNTIAQSLLNGVPLIVFPGAIFERRFNGQKVAEAGGGVWGEITDFTPGWLRGVFARRAEFAPNAARLGERIRSYGGAPAAVEAITAWAKR